MITFSTILFSEENPIVATVGNSKIFLKDLNKNLTGAKYFVTNKKVTKEYILNELINRELGIQKAKKNKLEKDPLVKSKIEDILYHAQISKDLENQLSEINVSDKEIKDFFKKYPEYRTSHILLRIKVKPESNELLAASKVATKIYKQLRNSPVKFEELANKHSQSPNAEIGGDVGFQPAMSLAPEYYEAIKGKPIGFITKPVVTQYGIHIIKVTDKKEYKNINKSIYQKLVYDKKRDQIISKYFVKLRKNASINITKKYLK
jgi:parvulin-like peptidyl-prolyl isomerase